MTNYATGHAAEKQAANYLKEHGFKIRQLNWKTKYCEIDIVAENKKVIYFVEVKFRKTDHQGSGLDYITPAKLRQMQFAAELWVSTNDWRGNYQLAALAIDSGKISFIDEL